jgi:hypothetical protein
MPTRLALAAVAECASSRSSDAARRPNTSHRRAQLRSGSIRHDHARRSPENPAYAKWPIGQSRVTVPRIYQTIENQPRRTVSSNKNASNQRSDLNPTRQNCRSVTVASRRRSLHHHQIPIARTAALPNLPRVPSLEAFGRRPRRLPQPPRRAVIRNPSLVLILPCPLSCVLPPKRTSALM